jgi:hypothetical protein
MGNRACLWGVFRRDSPTELQELPIAAFVTQWQCREWIAHMKEMHFFRVGSMKAAEETWSMDNFVIDRTIAHSRQDTAVGFSRDITPWSDD